MTKQYETVMILNPVLSQEQVADTVQKFKKILTDNGAMVVFENNWGLRKLAYPIQKKNTGFYHLYEFKAEGEAIKKLEIEYKRDERVMRFLTIVLDKHSIAYNEKKRKNAAASAETETEKIQ
jgi:small subunit ribosomal protein S6